MNHLGVLCSYSSGLFKCSIFPSTEHNIFFHRCLDLKNKSSSLDLMAENYTNKANEVFPSQPTFDLVLCRTHKFFMIVTIMIKIFKLQISSFELAFFIINMSASFFRVSIRMIWFSFFFCNVGNHKGFQMWNHLCLPSHYLLFFYTSLYSIC